MKKIGRGCKGKNKKVYFLKIFFKKSQFVVIIEVFYPIIRHKIISKIVSYRAQIN